MASQSAQLFLRVKLDCLLSSLLGGWGVVITGAMITEAFRFLADVRDAPARQVVVERVRCRYGLLIFLGQAGPSP